MDHTGLLSNHEKVRWVQRQKVHHRIKRDFVLDAPQAVLGEGEEEEENDDDDDGLMRRFIQMALMDEAYDDNNNNHYDDNRSGMRRSPYDLYDINDVSINDINKIPDVNR